MKILFISMLSIHAVRWIENLKETPFQFYWFDVLDRGSLHIFEDVHQFTNWKRRKLPYLPGEFFLSRNLPGFYNYLQPYIEVTASKKLKEILIEVQPDVVHSFEMQSCSYPILGAMKKFPHIKWIYSCWGSDLYYYKNINPHNKRIRKVLQRIDILHTDNQRDIKIAYKLGFKGDAAVIPGGGGYKLNNFDKFKKPLLGRNVILIKGYEHQFGRALTVIKAIERLIVELKEYKIVVFGAHPKVINYIINHKLKIEAYHRHELTHNEVLTLMGQSILYIGNSISDGIPNTLLEALIMGALPIQSNPGGVTEELIENGKNGFLIREPENIEHVKKIIQKAISDKNLYSSVYKLNQTLVSNYLDFESNRRKINSLY